MNAPRLVSAEPPELIVYDREHPCPYLRERTSRLPLRIPSRHLSQEELNERLIQGDRRQGFVLYQPRCPSCSACESIRIDVEAYEFTRSQKRILKRGDRDLEIRFNAPEVDARRVEIYNTHKVIRHLRDGQPPIDLEGYRDFLVSTCCDTFEFGYYANDKLIGLAIVDYASNGLSAVYCCYDEEGARFSLGTYSILKQIEFCRVSDLRYLYLGLYIKECSNMSYKADYLPHERLLGGQWRKFEKPDSPR